MCGFAAFFEKGRAFAPSLLDGAEQDLFHRGPDSGHRFAEPGAAMVFRRLAILDPEPRADQPFRDASGRYVLVFNGEIYNFRSLRRELEAKGVRFKTSGDTEVIAEGFARWGEALFEKLEGMFALVIFDTLEHRVTAARDPLGIKPLYLTRSGKLFAAASEMRPLRRLTRRTEVDPAALAELLVFRFAAGRLSNLHGIEMLTPGTLATFSLADGSYRERRFADLLDTLRPDPAIDRDEALALAEENLTRSLYDHLQSDVGFSIQLSGGVDSSLVLALASEKVGCRLDSYSIRLEDLRVDEARFRQPVVTRYRPNHTEVDLDGRAFADALPRANHFMEGPSPHLGCVMLMLLCETIQERHKVVLTGEGADEFFGGYDRYRQWRMLRKHGLIGRLVPNAFWPLLPRYRYLRRFGYFDAPLIASVLVDLPALFGIFPDLVPAPGARGDAAARFGDFRDRMLAVDQTAYLGSLLARQDKMAMAASVEARVPFAHMPLARALNRIPNAIRVPGGETKPLLKAIARKWLPRDVVDRRKVGLTLPIADWLRDEDGLGRYVSFLAEPGCRLAAYAAPQALPRLVETFRAEPASVDAALLTHLVNVELWLRTLDEDLPRPVAAERNGAKQSARVREHG